MTSAPPIPKLEIPENEGGRGRPFRTTHTICLYLPPNDEQLWKDFQAAMKRDGWTPSLILREWMRKYLKDHPLGNPQTPIERYSETLIQKPLDHRHLWHHVGAPIANHLKCDECGEERY